MNLVADVLFLFGGIALAYAAVLAATRLPWFPLRQLVLVNATAHVKPAQIELTAKNALVGNFFTVNIDAVRSAFDKLPWVRRTEVRRRWPDGIELLIEEHDATALWQHSDNQPNADIRMVNNHGEVFVAAASSSGVRKLEAKLPLFAGPEGSAPQVLARYNEISKLLAPLERVPVAVVLSPRQAWQLRLDDGLVLELGRDQSKHPINDRLQRFANTYREAKARARTDIAVIDMRYPNGFALRPGHQEKGKSNT